MVSVDVVDFVDTLGQSQLLEEPQRLELLGSLGVRFAEPRDLARELIRRGWLTPYQVNQLFLGRGDGLVLGPYVLLDRLGEGGMGQVFKARHQRLGRVVALKVIRKATLGYPLAVPRFEREVQAAAQLSHPNIVRAYDAGQLGGTYYFVMEYVEGTDLSRLVKESGPLPVPQACDYVRQAALGLQHAHERRLVHRDVKPANLLVTRAGSRSSAFLPRAAVKARLRDEAPDTPRPPAGAPWGVVKILDMGLARLRDTGEDGAGGPLTQVGTLVGTPDYIAPEQVCNPHTSDIRADLYSLGCTFYYLLTGRVPFPEGGLPEKLLQHQTDDPQPVEQVRRARLFADAPAVDGGDKGDVSPRVAAVVRRLMAKRPAQRFGTPAELAEALGAVR